LDIVEAIESPALLGGLPAFRDGLGSWRAWLVVWKAVYGLALDAAEVETFKRFTGRSKYEPPEGGWSTVVLCVGRRSGKTFCASILAAFSALSAGPSARGLTIAVVAQDFRSGQRNLFRAVSEPFDYVPAIAKTVVRRTSDTIALRNGLNIVVFPCKPTALRGLACRMAVVDEICFAASPDGAAVDRELVVALRPTMATVSGAKLCVLSSPSLASGWMFDAITENWGRDDSDWLCVQAPAYDLNPQLAGSAYLAEMRRAGDEIYASEVEGRFRARAAALFDPGALASCVVTGRVEIPPEACRGPVRCFIDPSGGRHDRFTAAIGYRDGPRVVVAALRAFAPPFSPAGITSEIAALARTYHVKTIVGDRFGGALVAELFQAHGLRFETSGYTASDLYQDMLSTVQSGAIELPDPSMSDSAADLIDELRSLERRPGGSGRDRVEAPRGTGRNGHADLANAVAGLVSILPARRARQTHPFSLDALIPEPRRGFVAGAWMDEAEAA
jgi:phage terminase large subunit-like protein